MQLPSTSLTVVRPFQAPFARVQSTLKKSNPRLQKRRSSSYDDVIEGEFREVLENAAQNAFAADSAELPYAQVMTPASVFKCRYVDMYV